MDLCGNFFQLESFQYRERKSYEYFERSNNWTKFNEKKFFQRFRLTKDTVKFVLRKIYFEIRPKVKILRAHDLTARDKLLMTLRFFATGSILQATGDFFGVSPTFASRVIRQVSVAIAHLRPQFIKFPRSAEEKASVCTDFFRTAKFPRCCGAIDCTHVRIRRPVGGLGEIYRNRKGYFSLNVQTISDNNLKVMDIVARWPGSSHDSTIFNNSSIRSVLESEEFNNYHIVGDKGYALRKFCLTPLNNPITARENPYNESLIRTRNVVERQYGVMKRRFPILAIGMGLKLDTVQSVTVACAILHNIACDAKERTPELPSEIRLEVEADITMNREFDIVRYFEQNNGRILQSESEKAKYYRQHLIANYFSNL